MTTPILSIPELSTTTGERSTIIEGFRILDAMWGNVDAANINATAPPASPTEGTQVLVGSPATGAFNSFDGYLAIFTSSGWQLLAPNEIGAISTDIGFYQPNALLDGWEVVPGTGLASPLTTKGDLWTFSASDDRLPVGADGQILAANSSTTTGLEWIAAPSGGSGGGATSQPLKFQFEADNPTPYADSKGGTTPTVVGTVPVVAGQNAEALSFSGNTANHLTIPAGNSSHLTPDADFFIAAWMNRGASASMAVYARDEYLSSKREIYFGVAGGGDLPVLALGNGADITTITSTTPIALNTWNHVLVTHEVATRTLRLYLNGVLNTEVLGYTEITSIGTDSTLPTYFGVRESGTGLDAEWDGEWEQLVFGEFLPTSDEITALAAGVTDAQSVFTATSTFSLTLDDGITSVSNVNTVNLNNLILVDNGSGEVTITGGSGASGTIQQGVLVDDFNDVDGTTIPTHIPSVGGPWVLYGASQAEIQSNRLETTVINVGTTGFTMLASSSTATVIETTVNSGNSGNASDGIAFRGLDEQNIYWFAINIGTGETQLRRLDNNVITNLDLSPATLAINTDYTLRVELNGNEIKCFLDNAEVVTVTDATHNGTLAGVRLSQVGNTVDNFNAYLSAASESRVIDTFQSANGTALTAHTSNEGGLVWQEGLLSTADTLSSPAAEIQGNAIQVNGDGNLAYQDLGALDAEISFIYSPAVGEDNRNSAVLRYESDGNLVFFNVREPNGDMSIGERNSDVATTFVSAPFVWNEGTDYAIVVRIVGLTVTATVTAQNTPLGSTAESLTITGIVSRTTGTGFGVGRNTGSSLTRISSLSMKAL